MSKSKKPVYPSDFDVISIPHNMIISNIKALTLSDAKKEARRIYGKNVTAEAVK